MDDREERIEQIEQLKRMIEEDEEILAHARALKITCQLRSSGLAAMIDKEGGVGKDGMNYMRYLMAERDLNALETMIGREKWRAERELEELEGSDYGEA